MTDLKYLGISITNQNYFYEEIKSTLNSGIACDHSVQNSFFPSFLYSNVKIKIHKTVVPVVLYQFDTYSATMMEEHRMWCLRMGSREEYISQRGRK